MDMERNKLLQIIAKNADHNIEDLAKILNETPQAVDAEIKKMIDEKIILGKHTVINWDKENHEKVLAFIEVGVTPERETGYDKVATRIFKYEEVTDCYLISGICDLILIIEGKTMQEIAEFVAMKLAPIDNVKSTATYFVLKTYKHNSLVFYEDGSKAQERVEIS